MAPLFISPRTRRRLRRAIRTIAWPLMATLTLVVMLFLIPFLALPSLWGAISERIDL